MGDEKLPNRVNLVDRPEWDDYDPAGALNETVFQAAGETVSSMTRDDTTYLAGLVQDVLHHGTTRGKRTYFTEEEDAALVKAFEGHYKEIETFWQMVGDAASWGWEIAYAPTKSDLEEAVKQAVEEISGRDSSWFYYQEALLAVADYYGVGVDVLKTHLLDDYVDVAQEEGSYDRYLVFARRDDAFIEDLLSGDLFRVKRPGHFGWMPGADIPKEEVRKDLNAFYRDIREPLVKEFFARLKAGIADMDPSNRFDFKEQWKRILRDDPKRVAESKRELLAFRKNLERKNG